MMPPARVRAEIRGLRRSGASLAYSDAPPGLVKAAIAAYGSWREAIAAAGLDPEVLGLKVKRYRDEELLDWLRALAEARPSMTRVELAKERRYSTVITRFGSWERAVRRAGLSGWPKRQKRRWTQRAIIDAMRALARDGKAISTDENLYGTAVRHFGTLQAAAEAAGVSVRQPRKRSRAMVVAKLREVARAHGTVTTARARAAGILSAAVSRFGSLTAACKAAGVAGYERTLARHHAELERATAVLDRLRAVATMLRRPVARRDLPHMLHQALLRHFGSLDVARRRAGLPSPRRPRKWDRDRVLAELRREHRRKTRITRRGLTDAGRHDLLAAIPIYVGTLAQARRLARVPAPEALPIAHVPFLKVWDEDRVLDEIRQRAADDEPLAPSRVPRPLIAAACRYLGSWRLAVEMAGYDYAEVVLRRDSSDDELLAMVRTLASSRPDMTLKELRRLPLVHSLYRHFGTPEAAARRAGVSAWPRSATSRVMSRSELRGLLRERVRTGKSISAHSFDRHVQYSMSRIHPIWSVAVRSLGGTTANLKIRPAAAGA